MILGLVDLPKTKFTRGRVTFLCHCQRKGLSRNGTLLTSLLDQISALSNENKQLEQISAFSDGSNFRSIRQVQITGPNVRSIRRVQIAGPNIRSVRLVHITDQISALTDETYNTVNVKTCNNTDVKVTAPM